MSLQAVRIYRLILFMTLASLSVKAQFSANAGTDKMICPGSSVTIGGAPAATGGFPPYTYAWAPSTGLSSTTVPNPTASPSSNITYTLTVYDDSSNIVEDFVTITMNPILYVNAGRDTSICENGYALLGDPANTVYGGGMTFSWLPSATLNDPTLPQPMSSPLTSTTYTMVATSPGCPPKTSTTNITVIPTPLVDAGNDTTIKLGERAILHGSGAFIYYWSPIATLTYYYSAHPNAEPTETTLYYLEGWDRSKKCPAYDSVRVFVEPSDDVVFYNTFTPNADGNNDTWYIGNILKYPDCRLEIYNRNSKLLYRANGYQNDWDGTAFGEELPAATYFFVLDLGNGQGIHNGVVTIIR